MTAPSPVRARLARPDVYGLSGTRVWRLDREGAVENLTRAMSAQWVPEGLIDPLRAAIVLAQANAPETEEVRFTLKSVRSGLSFEYILDLRP